MEKWIYAKSVRQFAFTQLCSIDKTVMTIRYSFQDNCLHLQGVALYWSYTENDKTLFEKTMLHTKRKPTKYMQYGFAMESSARDCYIAMQKQEHINLSAKETGLYARVDYLFLGTSPDGIVSYDCHF